MLFPFWIKEHVPAEIGTLYFPEAFHFTFLSPDVMDYEPDSDMLFNYLMVSALAEATDLIDRKGLRPTAGNKKII